MKKIMLLSIVLLAATLHAADKVLFTQDFENATVGTDLIGNMQVKNFNSGGGAAWTYDLATGADAISGNASAHINIQQAGDQWWGLQIKFEDPAITTVVKGLKYRISFKIKSSTDNNFCQFYVQAQSSFVQELTIPKANTVQDVTIETTAMDNSGTANFMWAFGNYANAGDIWIDDIVVTELDTPTYTPLDYSENFNTVVPGAAAVGDFDVANFGNGLWNFSLEQVGNDASNKCVRFDITQNSDDWWTLQFKNSKLMVEKGKQYEIGFKAKSNIPNTLLFRIEGTAVFDQRVELTGDDSFQTFTIESTPMDASGPANFMWAFGSPTALGTCWIDDITIREKTPASVNQPAQPEALNLYFSGNRIHFLNQLQGTVSIYNLTGSLVAQQHLSGSDCSITVPETNRLLLVKYQDNSGNVIVRKVVNQR
ncbi:MAG: hypothetical protein Q8914_00600 [Bacteroidota bacterium]|nr:hypothetical protein [Bacteroidota bacterium]